MKRGLKGLKGLKGFCGILYRAINTSTTTIGVFKNPLNPLRKKGVEEE